MLNIFWDCSDNLGCVLLNNNLKNWIQMFSLYKVPAISQKSPVSGRRSSSPSSSGLDCIYQQKDVTSHSRERVNMTPHGNCYMLRLNIRVIGVTLLNAAVSGYVTTQQVRQALTQVLGRRGGGCFHQDRSKGVTIFGMHYVSLRHE